MRRFGALAATAALAVATVLSQAPTAVAASFHGYSTAHDNSDTNYSGIKVTRHDLSLSGVSCVYQPLWVVDSSATNWVELGSEYGSTCVGVNNTWYYGYGTSGVWHLGGVRALTPGQNHVFSLYYYQGWYYSYVDSTNVYGHYDPRFFSEVSAGLESYDSTAHVSAFTDSSMQYTASGGSWKSWTGEDYKIVNPTMCGHWIAATNWQAGENQASC